MKWFVIDFKVKDVSDSPQRPPWFFYMLYRTFIVFILNSSRVKKNIVMIYFPAISVLLSCNTEPKVGYIYSVKNRRHGVYLKRVFKFP